jgi:hypothetical protein
MATPDPPPDPLQQLAALNKQVLRYSRHRFLGTWLALGCLALLTCAALLLAGRVARDQTDAAQLAADHAHKTASSANDKSNDIYLYLRGERGLPGVPGANGKDGAPGQPGSNPAALPPGPAGPKGAKGDAGAAGAPGATGAVGATGAAGVPGTTGPAGATGEIGPTGATGDQGVPGATGDQGAQGIQGIRGAKGEKGDTGPQGPPGVAGPQGSAGVSSVTVVKQVDGPDTTPAKLLTVDCPGGMAAISGGFSNQPADPHLVVQADGPAPDDRGWLIGVVSHGATLAWQVTAFAVCAEVQQSPR